MKTPEPAPATETDTVTDDAQILLRQIGVVQRITDLDDRIALVNPVLLSNHVD